MKSTMAEKAEKEDLQRQVCQLQLRVEALEAIARSLGFYQLKQDLTLTVPANRGSPSEAQSP